jgi:hypothetical protein
MEMRKKERCVNCYYSSFKNITTTDVYCNRYPPTIPTNLGVYMPITVNPEWKCGEYKIARAEGNVEGGLQTATNRPSDETAPCP